MTDKQREAQGERLKKIREDLGFTQVQFAEILGVTQPQLSRFEKGVNAISIEVMATVLAIDAKYNMNWLVTGEGQMLNAPQQSLAIAAEPGGIYLTEKDVKIAKLESFIRSKFADYDK